MIGRSTALILALFVFPSIYIWIIWKLRRQQIRLAPRLELFVGLGSLGGWSLFLALVGSGPLIIVPIAAFQILIALPASCFCLARLTGRPRPTHYHRGAMWVLTSGILIPIGTFGLAVLFDSFNS
ncbi:MAG: hypothetical protein JWL90_3705 [Chthoniobacteraceae bacterium]|nr:hypothetical protein [Chthoniobacteraceae bacterium]